MRKKAWNAYTIEAVNKIFLDRGLIPQFEKYYGNNEKLDLMTIDGYKVQGTLSATLIGKRPSVFGNGNPHTLYNMNRYIEIHKSGYKLLSVNDINTQRLLDWQCDKGHTFKVAWSGFYGGRRCPVCAGHIRKTVEQFRKQFKKIAGEEYELLSEYNGDAVYVKVRHNTCNHEYNVTPSHFIGGKRCPRCGRPRGENNNMYNPNLTDKDRVKRRVQYGEATVRWRNSVYEKDNHTCQACGHRGGYLNAHHMDGYNWCEKGRFDVKNGVTLCRKCHRKFHGTHGIRNNTKEQYSEFLEKESKKLSISI